jgi:PGM1 C-terminal domain
MRFDDLQRGLGPMMALNRPGRSAPHVCVALPSFSVGESLLSHYADRIPALEHRYLLSIFLVSRIEDCEVVFLSSAAPAPEVLEYYASLLPAEARSAVRDRFRVFEVPDASARSVAAKLLDRPDLLDDLQASFAGRPAFIEPWNVTDLEVEVACRLGAPINGTPPALWPLGFKSAGRKLFAAAGVPVPAGREDVRTPDDVVAAIGDLRAACPDVTAVVVKHDDSGAGDGNVVIEVEGTEDDLRRRLADLPDWYLADLLDGGVVEERVTGQRFTSPSVQVDIRPDGEVVVLATHEQVLSGDDGQVYSGCRFPAEPAYAPDLARHGRAVGAALAERGALGRLAVDFAAASDPDGSWRLYALEVNLRKGGTTHPFAALRHLVPGRYEEDLGRWVAEFDDRPRWYSSTDNLLDPGWIGLAPQAVIDAVAGAGLRFDHATGRGVVLHMLSCLAVDGRFGFTAIGCAPEDADDLAQAVGPAVDRLAA